MVESILRMNHVVKAYECNWKGELSLSHVVGIMMLASRKQERSLAHPDLIYQKGLSWIVIQNQLTVNRLPKLEEEIIIETEPVGYNKFFTFRRYTILSLYEEVLVDALTTFSMINIEERKLISLDEVNIQLKIKGIIVVILEFQKLIWIMRMFKRTAFA